jgi:cation-transporting P-type ATPase I
MPSGKRLAEPGPDRGAVPWVGSPRSPVILHAALPGRLRIHLPGWSPAEREVLERRLRMIPGVREATAAPETGNVLLLYDPALTDPRRLTLAAGRTVVPKSRRPKTNAIPRLRGKARTASPSPAGPARSTRLARAVLLNFPSVLALLISLLTCSTPLGAARVGLEVVQLAMQMAGTA